MILGNVFKPAGHNVCVGCVGVLYITGSSIMLRPGSGASVHNNHPGDSMCYTSRGILLKVELHACKRMFCSPSVYIMFDFIDLI